MFLESNASWIPVTYVGSSIPGTYLGSSTPGQNMLIKSKIFKLKIDFQKSPLTFQDDMKHNQSIIN